MGKDRVDEVKVDKYERLIAILEAKKSMNEVSKFVVFASIVYLFFLNYFAVDGILARVSKIFSYQYSWLIAIGVTLSSIAMYVFFASFMLQYLKKEKLIQTLLEDKINGSSSSRNRRRV
jgi:hypothetical protein